MKGETTLEKVFLGEWQTAVYKCQTWESIDIKGFSGGCIDRYQMECVTLEMLYKICGKK